MHFSSAKLKSKIKLKSSFLIAWQDQLDNNEIQNCFIRCVCRVQVRFFPQIFVTSLILEILELKVDNCLYQRCVMLCCRVDRCIRLIKPTVQHRNFRYDCKWKNNTTIPEFKWLGRKYRISVSTKCGIFRGQHETDNLKIMSKRLASGLCYSAISEWNRNSNICEFNYEWKSKKQEHFSVMSNIWYLSNTTWF